MNSASALRGFVQDLGYEASLGREDGIPHLELWRKQGGVFSFDEVTRLAAKLNYVATCPVHFHRLEGSSVSFFVYDGDIAFSQTQQNDYGHPLGDWLRSALALSEPQPASQSPAEEDLVQGQTPSTSAGYGFNWIRPLDFACTARSGKWCVTVDAANVDVMWNRVATAVREHWVEAALVSTPIQAATHGGSFLIAVFTRDWLDVAEVKAARELLRSFGVEDVIGYKLDTDTARGLYDNDREWIYRA